MSDHATRLAANPWRRWYWTARWRKLAKAQLRLEPLCRMCAAGDVISEAVICDHVERHGGDETKFWAGPFQSLCRDCHDRLKQRAEHGRQPQALDDEGWPVANIADCRGPLKKARTL